MKNKRIQIDQLESKIRKFSDAGEQEKPTTGWIRAVRLALGMSLQQLAGKLKITKQSLRELEMREKEGSITLKSLRDAANALEMELVYGLVPKDGSLEKYIDKKANALARDIVMRSSNNMKLEDQEVSKQRQKKAIKERTLIIKRELPKALWD